LSLPPFHRNTAVFGIDAGNNALRTNGSGQFCSKIRVDRSVGGKKSGTDNDTPGSGIKNLTRALDCMDAAARLAGQALCDLLDKYGVVALAHRRVKVNELDERIFGKFFDPVLKVVEGEAKLFTLHQLNDASAEQINRRNQHGSLTGTPDAASSCFNERALEMPK